jgi:hypothetical protein
VAAAAARLPGGNGSELLGLTGLRDLLAAACTAQPATHRDGPWSNQVHAVTKYEGVIPEGAGTVIPEGAGTVNGSGEEDNWVASRSLL